MGIFNNPSGTNELIQQPESVAVELERPSVEKTILYTSPKVRVKIGDYEFNDVINVETSLSIGADAEGNPSLTADSASITIPNSDGKAFTKLNRYALVKIWLGYQQPNSQDIDSLKASDLENLPEEQTGMYLVFTGILDKIEPKSSMQGNTISLTAISKIGYLNRIKSVDIAGLGGAGDGYQVIEQIIYRNKLDEKGIFNINPQKIARGNKMKVNFSDKTIAQCFEEVRKNSAYLLYVDRFGDLVFQPPSFFMDKEQKAWDLIYGKNIIECSVPDVASRINHIIVVGRNDKLIAEAYDPTHIALSGQQFTERLVVPTLFNEKDLREYAKETLLNYMRNYKVTVRTIMLPQITQGDFVRIDHPYLDVRGYFMVRSITHSISKSSGATTEMELFQTYLTQIPADKVVTRVFDVTKKTWK
jgi:hypothetical protein